MRSWISLVLLAGLLSCEDPAYPKLQLGPEVLAGAKPKLERIAFSPTWVWLKETYPSKPEGMSRCQAGQEVFLRLLQKDSPSSRFREVLHRKIASCHQDLELADNGLRWDPAQQTLTLQLLGAPAVTWRYDPSLRSFSDR